MLVGGPLFSHRPKESLRLFKEVFEMGKTTVMTTCVGSMWLADSGVLEGRKATVCFLDVGMSDRDKADVGADESWRCPDGKEVSS